MSSHLSTLVRRVRDLETMYLGNVKDMSHDCRFNQYISNLREYQEIWDNYTEEEGKVADELYMKYSLYLKKGV